MSAQGLGSCNPIKGLAPHPNSSKNEKGSSIEGAKSLVFSSVMVTRRVMPYSEQLPTRLPHTSTILWYNTPPSPPAAELLTASRIMNCRLHHASS